jgi:hypothetical protein
MYREIAGDDEFNRQNEIERMQLARLLWRFLGNDGFPDPHWKTWSKRDPDRWTNIVQIHVDFDINDELVDCMRKEKNRCLEIMSKQCETWRKQPTTFEGDIDINYRGRLASILSDGALVNWLVECAEVLRNNKQESQAAVCQFFASENWKEAPFINLWVRIWAKIAEMARNPKYPRKPQAGDYFDAPVLASYAPYCDAMFIDGGFRDIAGDVRVGVNERFGTQCFSYQYRSEFITYLDGIRGNMSEAHKAALEFVYPQEAKAL